MGEKLCLVRSELHLLVRSQDASAFSTMARRGLYINVFDKDGHFGSLLIEGGFGPSLVHAKCRSVRELPWQAGL
jgi:hypothetical protein